MLFPLQSYLHTFLLHEFLTITTPSNPPTVLGFSEPTVLWLGEKEKKIPLFTLNTKINNNRYQNS